MWSIFTYIEESVFREMINGIGGTIQRYNFKTVCR